jgi:hypothetical protein
MLVLRQIDCYKFSSPISTISQSLLVIAQINEQLWTFAIVVDEAGTNKVKVHLCNNHTLCEYDRKNIRQLRLLLSFFWQPEQPKSRPLSAIQSFIDHFKKTDSKPYMQAFCINSNTTIHVIGDIHGSSKSLLTFFKGLNLKNKLDDDLRLQPDTYIVCTETMAIEVLMEFALAHDLHAETEKSYTSISHSWHHEARACIRKIR